MNNKYAIGIDVGGTWVRVALVDHAMNVIKKTATRTSEFKTVDDYLDELKRMVNEVDEANLTTKMGMVVPAPWKDNMTHFRDATNVPFLEGVATQKVKSYFPNHHVSFENDVNVVALLESQIESRSAYESLLYITVSTGIGSGIVINNQIWQGAFGYAGEVGNMIVSERDKELVFVLEDICSGLALDVAAKSFYGDNSTSKTLFEAYDRGEACAIETIDSWFETFSDALASLMHVINPEILVLGGAVIYHNQWLIEELTRRTKPKLFENLREYLKIELSHYGSNSGVLGGAQLCFMEN